MPTKTGLAALFNRLTLARCKPPDEFKGRLSEVADVWISVLHDVSDEDLGIAVTEYLRKREGAQWWPAPGDLLALTPKGQQQHALEEAGDQAFGDAVYISTHRHDGNNPPKSPDDPEAFATARSTFRGAKTSMAWRWNDSPEICRAMDAGVLACGGWRAFCNLSPENHSTARPAFRNAYRTSLSRQANPVLRRLEQGRGSPVRMIPTEKP